MYSFYAKHQTRKNKTKIAASSTYAAQAKGQKGTAADRYIYMSAFLTVAVCLDPSVSENPGRFLYLDTGNVGTHQP